MQEGGYVQPPVWVNNGGGGLRFQTITLGGTDETGNDITNDMTYLALEVTGELQTIAPQIAVRIHDSTPKELYHAIFRCVRTGCAQPAVFNDKVNLSRLEGAWMPQGRGEALFHQQLHAAGDSREELPLPCRPQRGLRVAHVPQPGP